MLTHLRPAIASLLFFTALTGIAYPLAITGVAQTLLPMQANGSLIVQGEKIIGSALIGQSFTSDRYFHPRPSAAGNGYDASASSGTNLGPTSAKLIERVKNDVRSQGSVPADMVTTSASGLDPDISPENAYLQAERVANARGITPDDVRAVVEAHIDEPRFGFLGEARVNVLGLNMALDGIK
jgi:potassium-transporting ATPase KdpC subunit